MRNLYLILICLILSFSTSLRGQDYYSIAPGGAWDNANTWGTSPGGPGGAGIPTANDDVVLQAGALVTVPGFITNLACRNLYFEAAATSPVLSLAFFSELTINGTLLGYQGVPSANLITDNGGQFTFTGNSLNSTIYGQLNNDEIIALWNASTPLPTSVFNLSGTAVFNFINNTTGLLRDLTFSSNFTLNSGTLETGDNLRNLIFNGINKTISINTGATLNSFAGHQIRVTQSGSRLWIKSGATLYAESGINGGTNATGVYTLTIDGQLNTLGYVNAQIINIGASGELTTAFSGANQTEGWWFLNAAPTVFNLTGSVFYNATVPQNVYTDINGGYGTLRLGGRGSTKTLIGFTPLDVKGNFSLGNAVGLNENGNPIFVGGDFRNNNNTGWIPTVDITLDGTSDQFIYGNGLLTFDGALIIDNGPGAVVTLTRRMILNNDLEIRTDANFTPNDRNINITGNIIAEGTLQAGTGTFIFDGNTSVTGPGASFNNFTVNGSFTGPPAGTIRISGNITHRGTFVHNSGVVELNGNTAQNVVVEAASMDFYNLRINNNNDSGSPTTAFVNIEGNVDIYGSLAMATSTARIDADGTGAGDLTLKSTAINQDARIASLPNPANFTGPVSIERYVDGLAEEDFNWRFMSVPLTNANVGMWQDDFPVTGNYTNPSTTSPETPIIDPNAGSILFWNTATVKWDTLGNGSSTAGTSLENGRGYSVYTYRTSDFKVTTRGSIGKGNVNKTIPQDSWVLLGNPYPSAIDWDNMNITGLYGAVYLQNPDGSFATYLQGSGSGTNHPNSSWAGEISQGQSFWIFSETASNFGFSESNKTSSLNYQFLRQAEPDDQIRIVLRNNTQKDEITVRFGREVKDEFEPQHDALKFRNGRFNSVLGKYSYLNLSSYVDDPGQDMAINTIPFLEDCSKRIFLKIQDVSEGDHSISFSNIGSFNLGYELRLIDNFTGESMVVDSPEPYHFVVTADSASYGDHRFIVELTTGLTERSYNFFTENECSGDFVNVTIENAVAGASYEIYRKGERIAGTIAESYQAKIQVPKSLLSTGKTFFDLNCELGNCGSPQFLENVFFVEYDSIYEITEVENNTTCGPGMVVLKASGAPIDGHYRWYENEDDLIPIANEMNSELVIENLEKTTTYFVTAVNANGCESIVRQAVKGIVGGLNDAVPVVDRTLVTACINSAVTLNASGAMGDASYVWYDEQDNILATESQGSFVTPMLRDSAVFYVAIASEENCPGEKVMISVPVLKREMPVITEDRGILASSYGSNNQWYRDNELIPGATGRTYDTKLAGGSYTVEHLEGGCAVMSDPVIMDGINLENIQESELINLYPNPVKSQLFVEYNAPANGSVRLLIYTTDGKMVESDFMEEFLNGYKKAVDVTSYRGGIFITVIYDGEKYVYSKFRKQ